MGRITKGKRCLALALMVLLSGAACAPREAAVPKEPAPIVEIIATPAPTAEPTAAPTLAPADAALSPVPTGEAGPETAAEAQSDPTVTVLLAVFCFAALGLMAAIAVFLVKQRRR